MWCPRLVLPDGDLEILQETRIPLQVWVSIALDEGRQGLHLTTAGSIRDYKRKGRDANVQDVPGDAQVVPPP